MNLCYGRIQKLCQPSFQGIVIYDTAWKKKKKKKQNKFKKKRKINKEKGSKGVFCTLDKISV